MFDREDASLELLKAGADINIKGFNANQYGFMIHWNWSPLMAAAYKGHSKVVEMLLKKGADINETGWSLEHDDPETAADIAAYSGHFALMKYLIEKGGMIGPETIFKTVSSGHIKVVEYLLEDHADINIYSQRTGRTLLMEAAWWGKLDLVYFLIKKGADVNLLSNEGYTALGEAVRNAEGSPLQYDIVKYLIKNGADVNLSAPFHMTPLMSASWFNQTALINLLIENGAK
jgi:ankyrin repeat protein